MLTKTIKEFREDAEREIKECRFVRYSSNSAKQVSKMKTCLRFLDSIPESVSLTVKPCNDRTCKRDFELFNAGDLVECIVKYHLHGRKWSEVYTAMPGREDTTQGVISYEIKAGIESNSKPTPSQNANATILINRRGVFVIKKADLDEYVDDAGRLPTNAECGKPIEWLMERLGY